MEAVLLGLTPEVRVSDRQSPLAGALRRELAAVTGLAVTALDLDPRDESLFDKIEGIITENDFIEPLYHQVAKLVFEGHRRGDLNPAAILNQFIDDGDQYREAAALFNASLSESLSNEEQKKAFSETVVKVKKNSLDDAGRRVTDAAGLQRLIEEQAALRNLHISLD